MALPPLIPSPDGVARSRQAVSYSELFGLVEGSSNSRGNEKQWCRSGSWDDQSRGRLSVYLVFGSDVSVAIGVRSFF